MPHDAPPPRPARPTRAEQPSPPNRLVVWLLNNHHCVRLFCGTCGGSLGYSGRFAGEFPSEDELAVLLKEMRGYDMLRLLRNRGDVAIALFGLHTDEARRGIIFDWFFRLDEDPELASGLLVWGREFLLPSQMNQVQTLVELLMTEGRSVRDAFRKQDIEGLHLPAHIRHIFETDKKVDSLKENAKANKESRVRAETETARRAALHILSLLPYPERIRKIEADPSIQKDEWSALHNPADAEWLATLDLQSVQALIDKSTPYRRTFIPWTLQTLTDRRHDIRIAAMDAWRTQHGHLPPNEQLTMLAGNALIPLEHWPTELAPHATSDWLSSLPPQNKDRTLGLLAATPIRVWRKAPVLSSQASIDFDDSRA